MNLEKVNPIELSSWDDLVLGLSKPSFFYSSSWARVLRDTYGYTPMYFVLLDDNELKFMLPMMSIKSWLTGSRGVSLPFTDYCEPYVHQGYRFKDLFDEVKKTGKDLKWKSMEIRGGREYFQKSKPSLVYYCHTLTLADENVLFQKMKKSVQRNIRNASKQGVQVVVDSSAEAMDDFYRLNCITRRKHGLPPQPHQFFKHLYDYVIRNEKGVISRAHWKGEAIAASVFFHFGDQAIYKYGASDIAHLPLRANNLVIWEAIQHYAKRNYETLSFGKTEGHNEGLRRYKLGWGADEQVLQYYRYDLRSDRFVEDLSLESGWHTKILERMPLPMLSAVGRFLYRHIG